MPPSGEANTGASGSAPGAAAARSRWARHDRMRLGSPLRAAASSCGTTAARLSRSVSPALMPPTSGSTSCSNTSSPSRRRRYGRDGDVVAGHRRVGRRRPAGRGPRRPARRRRRTPGRWRRARRGRWARRARGLGQAAQAAGAGDVGGPLGRGDQLAVDLQVDAQLRAPTAPGAGRRRRPRRPVGRRTPTCGASRRAGRARRASTAAPPSVSRYAAVRPGDAAADRRRSAARRRPASMPATSARRDRRGRRGRWGRR